MSNWIKNEDNISNVVISSRIRLARNLIDYPFPNKLKKEEAEEIMKKIKETIINGNTVLKDEFKFYKMDELDEIERKIMVENHLISMDLANNKNAGVLIKNDETVSIMINEEDHLRIQTLFSGFKLDEAWDIADKIDDILEENLNYTFDEKLGYLTSCPTNVGTGLRASIMIHLPALVELGYINGVLNAVNQIGLAVRGIYGEGSGYFGNIYQISNQLTLGRDEKEIIGNIIGISKQIIEKELSSREILKNRLGPKLEDRFFRSLGILKNARLIDSKEAMNLLSNIKLGIEMGYIEGFTTRDIDSLMIQIQPAYQFRLYNSTNSVQRDMNRAKFIREKLSI
ncbi:protein arginine kinase [Tepidibacter formicigenes]|jgi:protein arginine kinase|uniref:Protein-arginine kinase n=1 Tax=Tepidibacter formicigenes DSM 15518 TaxID=1123349 RepID=A0A1M6QLY2_9FIRM|nr:protein arginine kinase [Tepidibacter formicigenes]SHK21264.1 protein arginine kinase [Tepidibacter formicigenes DSM 15518]